MEKINKEWVSPGANFYPLKFTMTCIATDGTKSDYSIEIPINPSDIKAGRNLPPAFDIIPNLTCIPSYIRLFTILPSRQDPYYSNYVQPRSV